MIISRVSPVTGQLNRRDIDVTTNQIEAWENGALIQDVMPHITPEDREFILSGCTPEDFDTLFPEEV